MRVHVLREGLAHTYFFLQYNRNKILLLRRLYYISLTLFVILRLKRTQYTPRCQ